MPRLVSAMRRKPTLCVGQYQREIRHGTPMPLPVLAKCYRGLFQNLALGPSLDRGRFRNPASSPGMDLDRFLNHFPLCQNNKIMKKYV